MDLALVLVFSPRQHWVLRLDAARRPCDRNPYKSAQTTSGSSCMASSWSSNICTWPCQ